MRRVLVIGSAIAALALLLSGSAAAASHVGKGTPKSGLAAYGYHLFGEYCLGCHGGNAAGRENEPPYATGAGPLRIQAQQGGIAPSLHGVGALAADFYLRTGYMPLAHVGLQPRRTNTLILSDGQIRALTAYIATFGGPPIPKPQPWRGNVSEGMQLFTDHCAGCHQVVAQGGYVTDALPPPLVVGGVTATEIAEAVRIGPYVMPKFTYKDISERQLDSIVRYVLYAQHPYHPGGWGLNYLGPLPEGLVTWFLAIPALLVACMFVGRRLRKS